MFVGVGVRVRGSEGGGRGITILEMKSQIQFGAGIRTRFKDYEIMRKTVLMVEVRTERRAHES